MKTLLRILPAVVLLGCAAPPAPPKAEPTPARACGELGCTSGLDLELVRSSPWPHGSYRVTLRIDGKSVSCEGSLPLRPCDQGPSFHCDDPSISLSESGCALPPEQHAIGGLRSTATETSDVSLVIEHQGALQATAKLTPTFQTLQPNGAGCEPVCQSASMRLTLR